MLKKGDVVVMHTCGEAEHYEGKLWVCKSDEQKLHEEHNYTVVWLEGFSGCFSTKYLQKVDTTQLEGIKQLKITLEDKVKEIDKRIERRNGPCYFDESDKIKTLHSEAYGYETVIKMIDEITA